MTSLISETMVRRMDQGVGEEDQFGFACFAFEENSRNTIGNSCRTVRH